MPGEPHFAGQRDHDPYQAQRRCVIDDLPYCRGSIICRSVPATCILVLGRARGGAHGGSAAAVCGLAVDVVDERGGEPMLARLGGRAGVGADGQLADSRTGVSRAEAHTGRAVAGAGADPQGEAAGGDEDRLNRNPSVGQVAITRPAGSSRPIATRRRSVTMLTRLSQRSVPSKRGSKLRRPCTTNLLLRKATSPAANRRS